MPFFYSKQPSKLLSPSRRLTVKVRIAEMLWGMTNRLPITITHLSEHVSVWLHHFLHLCLARRKKGGLPLLFLTKHKECCQMNWKIDQTSYGVRLCIMMQLWCLYGLHVFSFLKAEALEVNYNKLKPISSGFCCFFMLQYETSGTF